MKEGRHISTHADFPEAMRQFLLDGPSGGANAKVVAAICGHGVTYSYRYADPEEPRHFPLAKLAPVVDATRDYRLLDWIEAQVGRVAFEVPEADEAGGVRQVAAVLRDAAECADSVLAALKDGRIDAGERERFNVASSKALSSMCALRAWINGGCHA